MNTLMIRNAIGKPLDKIRNKELINLIGSMQTYTEAEYKTRQDFESAMVELSILIDRALRWKSH